MCWNWTDLYFMHQSSTGPSLAWSSVLNSSTLISWFECCLMSSSLIRDLSSLRVLADLRSVLVKRMRTGADWMEG